MAGTTTGKTSPSAKRKLEAGDVDNDDRESSSTQQDAPAKRTRTIGPAMPPPGMIPQASDDGGSSESDDDDYGPALPPPEGASAVLEDAVRGEIDTADSTDSSRAAAAASPSKRDDWMLRPPNELNFSSRVDPTKIRNRKFNPHASRQAPSSGTGQTWTETPDEKRKRLENEVMGIRAPAGTDKPKSQASEASAAMAKQVQEYNEKNRNKSLYAQHRSKQEDPEKDDPSARPFDKEKDIRAPSRITNAQRREMLNRAADFSSRFSGGNFL
ncbi:hypothetical protein VTO42DRAFT_6574 [Malbranchea cinnamomea]